MKKIFKQEELNLKKNEHVTYSESYEVKFWIQGDDTFWKQETEIYFSAGKGDHEYILSRWKKDYAGKNVKLPIVTYQ